MTENTNKPLEAVDPNLIIQLVAQLLPIVLQYGTKLVEDVIKSIKTDPSLPADQLSAAITQRLNEAAASNQSLTNETE